MAIPGPPKDLDVKVPEERVYEQIFKANTTAEIKARLVPSILHENKDLGFSLYGVRIFTCDTVVQRAINDHREPVLPLKGTFQSRRYEYTIDSRIGDRSYLVMTPSLGERAVLKLENSNRIKTGPRMRRAEVVYKEVEYLRRKFSNTKYLKHFMRLMEYGEFGQDVEYLLLPEKDRNLHDVLQITLGGKQPSRATCMFIATQTLQAIHDLQLIGFIHRDIRPSSFIVGQNRIYISNFDNVYQRPINRQAVTPPYTLKIKSMNCRFQSRNFHTQFPAHRKDDVESWLFMMLFCFDPALMPWRKSTAERVLYHTKCRLVRGDFKLGELEPFFRPMLYQLDGSMSAEAVTVDYPFYVTMLQRMCKAWGIRGDEPIDWEPDPKRPNKNRKAQGLERVALALLPVGTEAPTKKPRPKRDLADVTQETVDEGQPSRSRNRRTKKNVDVTQDGDEVRASKKSPKTGKKNVPRPSRYENKVLEIPKLTSLDGTAEQSEEQKPNKE